MISSPVFLQRRPMTLLELVISMVLTISLLTILGHFYLHVNRMGQEMDRVQQESFEKRYVENRLAAILPKAVCPANDNESFHFFSSNDLGDLFKMGTTSLVFTFDNKVQLSKEMAHYVIGRLYVDKEGCLTLATWPAEKRWKEDDLPPVHREVLLENVATLAFSFFVPPKRGKTYMEEQTKKKEYWEKLPDTLRTEEWPTEWRAEYRQLPAIVKISLDRAVGEKEEQWEFAFPLPHTLQPITYDH